MSGQRTSASARLELVIDIPASSSWGRDCTIDQIYRQAGEETTHALGVMLRKEFGPTAKIIGVPKVQAVIAQDR